MMDLTAFMELKAAPHAVFDNLTERRDQVRFKVPGPGGWTDVTWGDFAAALEATALWLADGRLAPGQRAAILAGNSVQWMTAALAIQAAGGVLVPIYGSCTVAQVRQSSYRSSAEMLRVSSMTVSQFGDQPFSCRLSAKDW